MVWDMSRAGTGILQRIASQHGDNWEGYVLAAYDNLRYAASTGQAGPRELRELAELRAWIQDQIARGARLERSSHG